MVWKNLILYANTFITTLVIVIIVQLGIAALLFFTETTRRFDILGRLFVEVINDGGIRVQLGFDSSIILALALSFVLVIIINVMNKP